MIDRSSVPLAVKKIVKPGIIRYGVLTNQLRVMPDFIIIGASKCGTTSLYKYLSKHPDIVPALSKEIHFFDLKFAKGIAWYRAHFPSSLYKRYVNQVLKREFVTGEGSPYYIFHPQAPKRIAQFVPQAKFIVMLRNPVDRAYSHYQHSVRGKHETLSFEAAIDKEAERLCGEAEKLLEDETYYSRNHRVYSYLARGVYVDQLKIWMNLFPRERFLILKSEDFFTDLPATLKQVTQFLNLPDWMLEKAQKYNVAHYSEMDAGTRKRLIDYFAPHNQRLYDHLGVDFGWDK